MKTNSPRVPESMQALYDEITSVSDAFCEEYLNDEYAGMIFISRSHRQLKIKKRYNVILESGHAGMIKERNGVINA